MTKLSGKALQERAKALSIPGRSKLSADELRSAIEIAEVYNDRLTEETKALPEWLTDDVKIPVVKVDRGTLVPNRADKRKAKRSRKLNEDGTPKGGFIKNPQSDEAKAASILAGEQGDWYGNRRQSVQHSPAWYEAVSAHGPRSIPVNVIHEGH